MYYFSIAVQNKEKHARKKFKIKYQQVNVIEK